MAASPQDLTTRLRFKFFRRRLPPLLQSDRHRGLYLTPWTRRPTLLNPSGDCDLREIFWVAKKWQLTLQLIRIEQGHGEPWTR